MDTKTQLLDHAQHLSRTRGFDAFSYADLAGQVGIRKASIHYHFATKGDLADALITRYADRFLNCLDKIAASPGTAADHLKAYVALYREALGAGGRLCLCVSFSASRDSFGAATLAQLTRFHKESRTWLAHVVERAALDASIMGPLADPQTEAQACLALMEGAQLVARAEQDPGIFDMSVAPLLARLSPQKTH